MQKKLIALFGFILLLFLSPFVPVILFSHLPQNSDFIATQSEINQENIVGDKFDSSNQLVYSSSNTNILNTNDQIESKKALILFTPSHEAFIPIVKNVSGQTSVYHPQSNITAFGDVIKKYFELNSINVEILAVDTMDKMKKTNRSFSEAYDVVRPYLVTHLQNSNYDIIIDLHRDSTKRKLSTLNYKNETYGKLYFVVGENNPNFISNKNFAEEISSSLNEYIPGISRGVIGKKGEHVDGIYNQDLAKNMILVELGGIENTQDEINRTLSVLSKAISTVLQKSSLRNL
ncbi:MAG: stage II sporulation protein P [Psychrobacillus psychrodurans]